VSPDDDAPVDVAELDRLERMIDAWANGEASVNPVVASVERGEPGERRWYLRIRGETKDVYAIWFTLRQRSLHFETYVMPAPEENPAEFFEHLLRRNRKLVGVQFCIGDEDAVFLAGSIPVHALDERELDHALGSVYAAVELCFQPALRIGFASRFGS
jgi:Putative bacterial sensory transduction regulator